MGGDSSEESERMTFETFLGKLKEVKSGNRPFTVILDDPLANSYIQNLYTLDLTVDLYERTWDQNELLGLNDMKVEGYEDYYSDSHRDHHPQPVQALSALSDSSSPR
ncbi:nucleolar zinc-finger protein, partial [Marasmius crinis-equi]